MRTIWHEDGLVRIIDQTWLPARLVIRDLPDVSACAEAISTMRVRGAPLIGATAAWGMALAMQVDPSDTALDAAVDMLTATRPTAVNLRHALESMAAILAPLPADQRAEAAADAAHAFCDDDVEINQSLGRHGLQLLREMAATKPAGEPLNILTHCNAGWLATVDRGTATAPIYAAHEAGIPVHVWVDETRPRNQGASLTCWELGQEGIPHHLVADNAGGHLMQHGRVDLVLVGTDRTTRTGDVCNKIGTYLKALAARDNDVPFWVALPTSTIDFRLDDGMSIPIEERSAQEVLSFAGVDEGQVLRRLRVAPPGTAAVNPAFDVTPAHLVDGYITEHGLVRRQDDRTADVFADLTQPGSPRC